MCFPNSPSSVHSRGAVQMLPLVGGRCWKNLERLYWENILETCFLQQAWLELRKWSIGSIINGGQMLENLERLLEKLCNVIREMFFKTGLTWAGKTNNEVMSYSIEKHITCNQLVHDLQSTKTWQAIKDRLPKVEPWVVETGLGDHSWYRRLVLQHPEKPCRNTFTITITAHHVYSCRGWRSLLCGSCWWKMHGVKSKVCPFCLYCVVVWLVSVYGKDWGQLAQSATATFFFLAGWRTTDSFSWICPVFNGSISWWSWNLYLCLCKWALRILPRWLKRGTWTTNWTTRPL